MESEKLYYASKCSGTKSYRTDRSEGIHQGAFAKDAPRSLATLAVAGLLIGYGARLANGCTSGHGILGVSRLSARALVAVTSFSVTAAATVALVPVPVTP
jgi:uncharacterized membrane protein YedE/YeeE